ncbi:unnamed protein product [Cuscuta europaea]|uniref:Uncharacterized protein n=1 Tax=Cuscuta europaea TaxID=41803 RepID=A0A9P0ZYU6_CUSEU|nr:unnamed protein product [Cuscuta europaea]
MERGITKGNELVKWKKARDIFDSCAGFAIEVAVHLRGRHRPFVNASTSRPGFHFMFS